MRLVEMSASLRVDVAEVHEARAASARGAWRWRFPEVPAKRRRWSGWRPSGERGVASSRALLSVEARRLGPRLSGAVRDDPHEVGVGFRDEGPDVGESFRVDRVADVLEEARRVGLGEVDAARILELNENEVVSPRGGGEPGRGVREPEGEAVPEELGERHRTRCPAPKQILVRCRGNPSAGSMRRIPVIRQEERGVLGARFRGRLDDAVETRPAPELRKVAACEVRLVAWDRLEERPDVGARGCPPRRKRARPASPYLVPGSPVVRPVEGAGRLAEPRGVSDSARVTWKSWRARAWEVWRRGSRRPRGEGCGRAPRCCRRDCT